MARDGNPNWLGGTSLEPYPFEWADAKRAVMERDGSACQNPGCYGTSTKINVHHIDYNKRNCAERNLITLCVSCNARANHGRERWGKLYVELIAEKYQYETFRGHR